MNRKTKYFYVMLGFLTVMTLSMLYFAPTFIVGIAGVWYAIGRMHEIKAVEEESQKKPTLKELWESNRK